MKKSQTVCCADAAASKATSVSAHVLVIRHSVSVDNQRVNISFTEEILMDCMGKMVVYRMSL